MTRDVLVAGGGNRSRGLRLLSRGHVIVWLVGALVVGVTGTLFLKTRIQESRYGGQAALIAELRGLVGENGLFMRPGLSTEGGQSWAASGYGLPALAAATGGPPTLIGAATLHPSLESQTREDPVWGRWYGTMVERSTGTTIAGTWADGILAAPVLPAEPAARIATVAAIADVVAAKSLPLSAGQRDDFASLLGTAVAAVDSRYSRCRALQAAEHLRIDPARWSITTSANVGLPGAFSPTAVMDVYGSLCLAERLGRPLSAEVRQRVIRWLEPQLGMEVGGAEFETYYVVQSWLLAGGERTRLAPIADKLRARLDPQTGLLRERVVRLGTLENTYYAAVLADAVNAFGDIAGKRTLEAVRRLIPELRAKGSITDLLMSAVVLRYADTSDAALESEATGLAQQWLAGGIKRETVVQAARVVTLLQQLGRQVPAVHATAFPINGAEDRYLAWTLLGISAHLQNAEDIRKQLSPAVVDVVPALTSPDQLMVKEVAAAMTVPGSDIDRNHLPAQLTTWAGGVRGCHGFRMLYRPVLAESRCSLEATAQMISIGLSSS